MNNGQVGQGQIQMKPGTQMKKRNVLANGNKFVFLIML